MEHADDVSIIILEYILSSSRQPSSLPSLPPPPGTRVGIDKLADIPVQLGDMHSCTKPARTDNA